MRKVFNEKVMNIVFVCLGFVNILSFLVVPFFGPFYYIDGAYPTPIYFLMNLGGFATENLFQSIVFIGYTIISLFFIVFGLVKLLSKKAKQKALPISSNKNPYFVVSLVLLMISVLAFPMFYVNAYLLNETNCSHVVTEWGYYGNGYGTYTIFPLNALISLAYILWVILLPVKK